MDFLIISGLSGAGKSRVADVLEDMDFYCVDNMPIALLTKFAELCLATRGRYERVALVTDVRASESFTELFEALDTLHDMGVNYRILYVEASEATIVKRYKESRRPHPLAAEYGSIQDAVRHETELLRPIREESERMLADKAYLQQVYTEGAKRASAVARRTLRKVYKRVGFVEKPF